MRATSAVVVAVGLGVALSVILTSSGLRASTVPGVLGLAVLVTACVYIGWLVAQFTSPAVGLAAAPVVVVGMIGVLLGVKLIRLPFAPLVGDAFEIFVLIYAGAGVFGAVLGQVPLLRSPAAAAARIGLLLTGAALVLSVTTLALDAVIGA